jgi:hypothetical protein
MVHVYFLRSSGHSLGCRTSFVRYDTENGGHGEELNGRISYDLRGEEKFAMERYNRVEAIVNASIEGNMNNCIIESHKRPVASAIRSQKKLTYVVEHN